MGSRRKRKAQRSTDGAARVASHARQIDDGPLLASSAPMASSSSGNTQPPTPISSGTHSALTDTGKHPRVVPVTKQSEDGTYELVYETVDDTITEAPDLPEAPPPIWRRRPVQIGALVAVLVLVVGGIVAGIALSGDDDGPRQIRKASAASKSASATDDKDNTPYEYVAPTKHEGRLDDLDEDPKKGPAKPTARTVPNRKPPMPAAPVGNAQPEEIAENPGAIQPPLIDGSDFKRQPRLDLKGPIASPLGTGLKKPLDPRTRALLGSKLTDPTGAPIDDEEEEEDEDGEDEEEEGEEEEEDEEEGDDDEEDGDDDEEDGDDDEEEEEDLEEEEEEGDDEEDGEEEEDLEE